MNYKYKFLLFVLWSVLYTTQLQTMISEGTNKASNFAKWNFELYNKLEDGITISVWYEKNEIIIPTTYIPPFGMIRTVTEPKKLIVLSITNVNGLEKIFYLPGCPVLGSCHATRFLTLNKKDGLKPQTGPWLGLLGVTESGLSLANNISPQSIGKQKRQPEDIIVNIQKQDMKRKR